VSTQEVRPTTRCLFEHQGRLLLKESFDASTNEIFYQPIGGKIEFAETAQECIIREVYEEIHAEITDICFLGTIEHIYTLNGIPGHGLILLFSASFVDSIFYRTDTITGYESNNVSFVAKWLHIDLFREKSEILGPSGILSLLERHNQGMEAPLLTIRE
jgi:8-oxo-dGTP pyrophosphatase MutT (NUDIX family)